MLRAGGHDVAVPEPSSLHDLASFEACVIGSAAYAGHGLRSARELVKRLADQLVVWPVWLLPSGPVGLPLTPKEEPVDVDRARLDG